jgi:cysteine sulfinate desulfinase/cysteine desulfurase-like protein
VKTDCIYLDYQATTPLDPRVAEAMQPYWGPVFGNPHSEHVLGWEAADGVDRATAAVAELIGAAPGEIVFTSGATEANNLAIQGVAVSTWASLLVSHPRMRRLCPGRASAACCGVYAMPRPPGLGRLA